MLGIFNIGPFELLLLAVAAVLLFGGDLPQNARKAGRMLAKLRATASELGRAVYDEPDELPPRLPPGHREPPVEVLGEHPPGATGTAEPPPGEDGTRADVQPPPTDEPPQD